ncbi:MAG: ribosome maturation factor RimM [Gammaproteobacteria bacterium]|nr:ribosome maturation factor RimM [Gammaproteobacteria bacterium]
MAAPELLVVGKISAVFGVKGWLRIYSYTEPRDNIIHYPYWYMGRGEPSAQWQQITPDAGKTHSKGVIVHLQGVDDRDAAALLIGYEIAIDRQLLPQLADDQYYWRDLRGCQVVHGDGTALGEVISLFETGANDVMVVQQGDQERLIPFTLNATVQRVDIAARLIEVDWDPDF